MRKKITFKNILVNYGQLLLVLFGILSVIILIGLAFGMLEAWKPDWVAGILATLAGMMGIKQVIDNWHNTKARKALLKTGKILFNAYENEFTSFYTLYLADQKKFIAKNKKLIKKSEGFDVKNLKPVEALYIFARSKNLTQTIDWRGQENEGEIQTFVETLLQQKPDWANTATLPTSEYAPDQGIANQAIDLFKAIDKDLAIIQQKLIFFNLNWDAYVYTVISTNMWELLNNEKTNALYGIEKLKV